MNILQILFYMKGEVCRIEGKSGDGSSSDTTIRGTVQTTKAIAPSASRSYHSLANRAAVLVTLRPVENDQHNLHELIVAHAQPVFSRYSVTRYLATRLPYAGHHSVAHSPRLSQPRRPFHGVRLHRVRPRSATVSPPIRTCERLPGVHGLIVHSGATAVHSAILPSEDLLGFVAR